jgi:hypothetical protein
MMKLQYQFERFFAMEEMMFGNPKRPFRGYRAMDEVRPIDIKAAAANPIFPNDWSGLLMMTCVTASVIGTLFLIDPQAFLVILGR